MPDSSIPPIKEVLTFRTSLDTVKYDFNSYDQILEVQREVLRPLDIQQPRLEDHVVAHRDGFSRLPQDTFFNFDESSGLYLVAALIAIRDYEITIQALNTNKNKGFYPQEGILKVNDRDRSKIVDSNGTLMLNPGVFQVEMAGPARSHTDFTSILKEVVDVYRPDDNW